MLTIAPYTVESLDLMAAYGTDAPGLTSFTVGGGEAHVYMNKHWYFSTSFDVTKVTTYTYGQADAQTVLLHELGHAQGPLHPWEAQGAVTQDELASVMWPDFVTRRFLNPDDIDGIANLYPEFN